MNKTNLVVLKGNSPLILGDDTYKPNKYYRCFTPSENQSNAYLIYGNDISLLEFDKHFEFAYNRVMREWESLGLIDMKCNPITKKKFKELSDIHTYGKNKVLFIRNNEIIYGFYVMETNNVETLNESYKAFIELLSGNTYMLDSLVIQSGNRGIPISGGNLKFYENNFVESKK